MFRQWFFRFPLFRHNRYIVFWWYSHARSHTLSSALVLVPCNSSWLSIKRNDKEKERVMSSLGMKHLFDDDFSLSVFRSSRNFKEARAPFLVLCGFLVCEWWNDIHVFSFSFLPRGRPRRIIARRILHALHTREQALRHIIDSVLPADSRTRCTMKYK